MGYDVTADVEQSPTNDSDYDDGLTFLPDHMSLYHWSPTVHRRQIIRYGLRPHMRPVVHTPGWKAPYICFADTPSWAWGLSGNMWWTPTGEWDLWQTWSDRLDPVEVVSSDDRPNGIHEVRTTARVYKRDLWWVGSRVK